LCTSYLEGFCSIRRGSCPLQYQLIWLSRLLTNDIKAVLMYTDQFPKLNALPIVNYHYFCYHPRRVLLNSHPHGHSDIYQQREWYPFPHYSWVQSALRQSQRILNLAEILFMKANDAHSHRLLNPM